MTQATLASELGITRNHLMACEAGKADFDTAVLCRACEVLHVSADFLIDSSLEEKPASSPKLDTLEKNEICFSAQEFAKRLRAARTAKGFTQYEVADRLGTTQPAYARYENGNVTPRADSLMRFASAIGTSVPYLLGLAEDPGQATLTDEESRLVADFRSMRPDLKGVLSKTAAAFARPAEGAGG